jgi:catechol 2,3-dioxygenase-like lactoylglutathione lyase family enzyme
MNVQTNGSFHRSTLLALMLTGALVVQAASAYAQAAPASGPAPKPAGPGAIAVGILHLNVTNLDQSLAFYRDVLGFEVTTPPTAPRANAGLVSDPGALIRTVIIKQPGGPFSMELVEWTGVPLRQQQPRVYDGGGVMLAMNVRDLDAKLASARRLGLKILTKDEVPFVSQGRDGARGRAIMVRDPDGFVVEFTDSSAPNPNLASGPIGSVAVFLSVVDLAKTVEFYNKVFGFTMAAPNPANPANERMKALFLNQAQIVSQRAARGTFPGSEFQVSFQEFSGPTDRKMTMHRVQDPGGPILLVTVQGFPEVVSALKASGGIIGVGEKSETLAADARFTWARDPNGVLLRVSLPAAPRAGGTPAAAPARP